MAAPNKHRLEAHRRLGIRHFDRPTQRASQAQTACGARILSVRVEQTKRGRSWRRTVRYQRSIDGLSTKAPTSACRSSQVIVLSPRQDNQTRVTGAIIKPQRGRVNYRLLSSGGQTTRALPSGISKSKSQQPSRRSARAFVSLVGSAVGSSMMSRSTRSRSE